MNGLGAGQVTIGNGWLQREVNTTKMKDEEISVEALVLQRMIREKGTYGFEDLCRMEAEEVCKRKGIQMTQDFFHGFLEASKINTETRNREENEKL